MSDKLYKYRGWTIARKSLGYRVVYSTAHGQSFEKLKDVRRFIDSFAGMPRRKK